MLGSNQAMGETGGSTTGPADSKELMHSAILLQWTDRASVIPSNAFPAARTRALLASTVPTVM